MDTDQILDEGIQSLACFVIGVVLALLVVAAGWLPRPSDPLLIAIEVQVLGVFNALLLFVACFTAQTVWDYSWCA